MAEIEVVARYRKKDSNPFDAYPGRNVCRITVKVESGTPQSLLEKMAREASPKGYELIGVVPKD